MNVHLTRTDDVHHFVGRNATGREVHFDTGPREGGAGEGAGPMQTVAMALGACSAIDVVNILGKARQEITGFDIDVDYERATDEIPAVFTRMHVHYALEGDIDVEKARRAVELSITKYCSVSKMLSRTATITHSFSVNGTRYE
jgi:putative redox protein